MARGRFQARGFLGTYEITVTADDKTRTVSATLGKGGARVPIRLE